MKRRRGLEAASFSSTTGATNNLVLSVFGVLAPTGDEAESLVGVVM